MRSENARCGARVRVGEHHRIPERRGMVGKIVGLYGGHEYMALDVRFPNGERRLFYPSDLAEEGTLPEPSWWRSLLPPSPYPLR